MLYLLYGDAYGINGYIKKILESNKLEDINISKYDLDAYNYKDVLEDASSVSLFDDKKIIIVSNASIFTSAKTSIELESFEKYIENFNPNTILIFTTENKIDERKKVTKLIKKHGTVKDFVIDDDPKSFIKSLLDDYKMDDSVINYFMSFVGNDNFNIKNEIDKLKLYKEDKVITKEDIDNITTKNIDDDLFKLMNYILENNILRRCYPLCSKCIKPSKNESEMNCLQCEYGYFLKEDTHNCIKPEEYKKREHKNISQMNSEFELLFIFILIFSIITAVGISLSWIIKKKEDKQDLEIDIEENQRIFKDNESDINEDKINNSNMNDNEKRKENIEAIN